MAIVHAENGIHVRPAHTSASPAIGSAPVGDLLVAICSSDGAGDPTISGSGWAEFVNPVNGTSQRMKSWWKVAGASEPLSVTFTFGGATAIMGFLGRWTGAHATTPAVNEDSASGSDNAPAPGSAGGGASDYLISAYYYTSGGVGPNNDDGYTQIAFDDTQGTLVVLEKSSASVTDPIFGTDTSDVWVGFNSGWDEAAASAAILRRRRTE